jgi:hypothetical protein
MWGERYLISRRKLLASSGLGFGSLALADLLNGEVSKQPIPTDLSPRKGHFSGSARSVIQLVQVGGPSQMDLFDPKPILTQRAGQPHPDGVEIHQPNNKNVLLPSPFQFQKYGQCGMELSEVFTHLGTVADELCLVRSAHSEHNNHPEGLNMLVTCRIFPGRPVLGAWVSYALGTENRSLPAYVVLRDPEGHPSCGKQLWSSGWLPAVFQGVEFGSSGTPVRHLQPSTPLPPGAQRQSLNLLQKLNGMYQEAHSGESELEARIQNYELAARMQLEAMQVLDLAKESPATRKLYGLDNPPTAAYGTRCLMARRLVEAGVRFVQVFPSAGQPWDQHSQMKDSLRKIVAQTDEPTVGLIKDLKSRGLLDSTVIMWAGEFGRLPTSQNGDGRDHNRNAMSLFFTGGGFKRGLTYGETDEFGYKAVVNRVGVPSLHATLLHLLGVDHERLIYPHEGRDQTPTDASVTGAKIVADLMTNPPKAL